MSDYIAKWHRELDIFSKIKPVLVLEGNVLDSYQYPLDGSIPKGSIVHLEQYLHYYFMDAGYDNVVFYDSLQGFYNTEDESCLSRFGALLGMHNVGKSIPAEFKGRDSTSATAIVGRVMDQTKEATVVIMRFASRYIVSPESMAQNEVDSFTRLIKTSLSAKEVRTQNGETVKNLLVLVVDKANDIPAWFLLQNPNVKTVTVCYPAKEERESLVKGENFKFFFHRDIQPELAYYDEHPDELEKIRDRFIGLTDGLTFTELGNLRRLCKNERIHVRNLCDVVDLYRFGVKETPWKKMTRNDVLRTERNFAERVKGQDLAVKTVLTTVKRALAGLSGLQGSSKTRPKGVLFFAGPTGTGKTETAKTLAESIFGDENSVLRFDMSEYTAAHTDQRLFGAPPGYVGYEAGGQLTNAVKKNPFSVLLFDEIDKAHPSIMDKFLQILEDGRMTDGQGNTVYFTETIIIFTSNLGIYEMGADGKRSELVTPDMSYEEVIRSVRSSVDHHFNFVLGRPELLNRIGENIVVFDFIRPNSAKAILESMLKRMIATYREDSGIEVRISDACFQRLYGFSLDNLRHGGRGVGNIVEKYLINPLSDFVVDNMIESGSTVTVEGLDDSYGSVSLVATVTQQ